jgi:hypothetical protein
MDTQLMNKFFSSDTSNDLKSTIETKIKDALMNGESYLTTSQSSYSFVRNGLDNVIITDNNTGERTMSITDMDGDTVLKTFSEDDEDEDFKVKHTKMLTDPESDEEDDTELTSDHSIDVEPINLDESEDETESKCSKYSDMNFNNRRFSGLIGTAVKLPFKAVGAVNHTVDAIGTRTKNTLKDMNKKIAGDSDELRAKKQSLDDDYKRKKAEMDMQQKLNMEQARNQQKIAQMQHSDVTPFQLNRNYSKLNNMYYNINDVTPFNLSFSDECEDDDCCTECGDAPIKGEEMVEPFEIAPSDAKGGATFSDDEEDDVPIKADEDVKPFDITPEDTEGGATFSDGDDDEDDVPAVKPIPVAPISEIGVESKDINEMNEGFHGSDLVKPFNITPNDAYNGGKTFSRYYDYGLFDDPTQAQDPNAQQAAPAQDPNAQQQAVPAPQPFTPQQIAAAPAAPAQTPIAMTGMTSPTPIPVGVPAPQQANTPTPMNVLLAPTGVDPNVAAQNNTAVAPVVNGSATAAVPAAVAQQQQVNQAQAAQNAAPAVNVSNQSVAQIPSQVPAQDPNAVQPVVDPNQQTEQQKTNSYVGDELYTNRQFTDYIDGSCNPYMTCEF